MNWKQIVKNIPNKLKIGKSVYEVFWSKEDVSGENVGETRFEPNSIIISEKQSSKEIVYTFWHEFLHSVSEEYDVKLSENQVLKLEKSLTDFVKFSIIMNEKQK